MDESLSRSRTRRCRTSGSPSLTRIGGRCTGSRHESCRTAQHSVWIDCGPSPVERFAETPVRVLGVRPPIVVQEPGVSFRPIRLPEERKRGVPQHVVGVRSLSAEIFDGPDQRNIHRTIERPDADLPQPVDVRGQLHSPSDRLSTRQLGPLAHADVVPRHERDELRIAEVGVVDPPPPARERRGSKPRRLPGPPPPPER